MFMSMVKWAMMSASGDPGLAVLDAMDAWVDANDSNITTVDISGPINLRATPNFSANVVKTNIVGPDGELGISLAESNGVAGTGQNRFTAQANMSFGYVDIR